MVKQYKVKWKISGSVGRPPYEGTVTLLARDADHAQERTRTDVKRSFPDVPLMEIKVESITQIA